MTHHPHVPPCLPEEKLYVCAVITNPADYESRIRLYHEFAKHMATFPNVELWTIEGSFPGKPYRVTEEGHPHHVRVELTDELWHKENLLNVLMLKHLPAHAKKIAWIDADVIMVRPDWVQATLKALDHHPMVQLFSQCADIDNHFKLLPQKKSGEIMYGMVYEWYRRKHHHVPDGPYGNPCPEEPPKGGKRQPGHCGYAWAARREVLESLGGLLEFSIVGSADYQMCVAWMTNVMDAVKYDAAPGYLHALQGWSDRVADVRFYHGDVGYIDGLVLHNFHGFKWHRFYDKRHKFYKDFDPKRDTVKDHQGVLCWNVEHPDHNATLIDELKWYFRHRKEEARYPEHVIDTPDPEPDFTLDEK